MRMGRVLHVALREYVETAKSKVFIISVLLVPLIMAVVLFFVLKTQKKMATGARPSKNIAIVDLSNDLADDVEKVFQEYNASTPERRIVPKVYSGTQGDLRTEQLKDEVRKGQLSGCLVIAKDAVKNSTRSQYFTKVGKMADMDVYRVVRRLFNKAVVNRRIILHDLSPTLLAEIRRNVPVSQVDITAGEEQRGPPFARLFAPGAFLILMFMGVFGTSQGMLTSVIEEKNSRVMEVLLSAVSPFQLMVGKIIGLALVGLTVVALWGGAGYWAAATRGYAHLITPAHLAYFIVYFVLGFVLIAALFAAIGAACNTLKEAQGLMTPIILLLMLPLYTWFIIAQNPGGVLALVFSFIPFTTPMVMPLRIAADPDISLFEIVLSLVILGASVPAVMWGAAKIFRTGVLMYGKPPSLRELLRWLRCT